MEKYYKISTLQATLTMVYVVCLVISNILAAKQYIFIGDIALNCGTLTFPITYILSDIFSEVYGYKWSRKSWLMAVCASLGFVFFAEISILLPYPDYWGNQEAFQTVLGSTPRALFASMVAFGLGDYLNDKVFKKMKEKHSEELKGFGYRAILSSFVGESIDSAVFLPLAFWGVIPAESMLITGVGLVLMKTGYECIILPVTKMFARKILNYEKNLEKVAA